MKNPEITKKAGIYEFIFTGEQRLLSVRVFDESDKKSKYEEQDRKCAQCGKMIKTLKDGHDDHIIPWSKGGRTTYDNLQILCVKCNKDKSDKELAEAVSEFANVKTEE